MTRLIVRAAMVAGIAMAFGCSSGGSNLPGTPVYANMSGLSASGTLIGGNVQNGPFSAKLANYSASTFKPWSSATIVAPISATSNGTGNLFVASFMSHGIYRIYSGSKIRLHAGSPFGFAGFVNASSSRAALNYPTSVTSDGTSLYVADSGNHAIRKIDMFGAVSLLAGAMPASAGHDEGYTDSSLGTLAKFYSPTGLTVVGTNLYVVDSGNQTIRRINMATKAVSTVAGSPGSIGSADGDRASARFNQPARITSDGSYLYVTDFGNKTVRRISLMTGAVDTIAGRTGVSGTDDGVLGSSRFKGPNGIATDGVYLYVTDFPYVAKSETVTEGTVRRIKLPPRGATFGTFSTTTISRGLNTPIGITTDGSALYVTDRNTHTITVIR